MALASLPVVRRILEGGFDFDLIDAHYYYPDGVAAVLLGRWLGKPVVITARGSDITYWPSFPLPRRMILWAATRAARNAAVSQALIDEMARLGFPKGRSTVLRNGVDLELFHEEPRDQCRRGLGFGEGVVAVTVGNLIELKGHHLVIEALSDFPEVTLIIIGSGPMEGDLRSLVERLGMAKRVRFVGVLPQAKLRAFYSAADLLVLASSREGWPNVLLESMACGTPVVATGVWGTPEVVGAPEAGILVAERSVADLQQGIRKILELKVDRAATRAYAERFSWDATTSAQLKVYCEVMRGVAE